MSKNKVKKPVGLEIREQAYKELMQVLLGAHFYPINEAQIPNSQDRALANKLISCALMRHGQIDYIIKQHLKKGLPKKAPLFEAILRIGICELIFMPNQAEHSAIFLAVEAIKTDKKTSHLSKLLNGVLRSVQRNKKEYQSLPNKLLFPNWLYEKWKAAYGDEALNQFAKALIENAPIDIVLREGGDSFQIINELNGVKIYDDVVRIYRRDKKINQLAGFSEGKWWVQDVSATLPAKLINLKKNSSVLDMCCAPGGKLLQLAKQKYEVSGIDIDAERLRIVKENLSRIGFSAKLEHCDALEYKPQRLFDAILLDAPCTASGTFRRHKEVLWQFSPKQIANRVKLQRNLIKGAINLLKPNGILVYCVCSLEKEEGEEQANWISQTFKQLEPYPIKKEEIKEFAQFIDKKGNLRIIPRENFADNIKGFLDGFFVARFRRK